MKKVECHAFIKNALGEIYETPDYLKVTERYEYPPDTAENRVIKKLAARCGRSLYKREEHAKHRAKLREHFRMLSSETLLYWAGVVMIDSRFCGASGTGAYIAVASRCCNEDASEVLRERQVTPNE